MKIYFNGDSNVAGTELSRPEIYGFAAKLSKKLGATSFINEAYHGASNSLILRRTNQYLNKCKETGEFPDLIVIGWTESFREDWFVDGNYCSISSIGLQRPELVDQVSHDYWYDNLRSNMGFWHSMSIFYNRAIHNLHLELNYLKIPHLFFNAINTLNYCEHEESVKDHFKDQKMLKLDWNDSYYHPYDDLGSTWRFWAFRGGYEQLTLGLFHFEARCQEDWAQLMYDYIKEKKLL